MGLVREAPRSTLARITKARRSNELSCKGHRLLAEGEFQRALKFLDLAPNITIQKQLTIWRQLEQLITR